MKTVCIATALFAMAIMAIGCGTDGNPDDSSGSSEVESETRIFDREAELSSDDLVALGMKSGKEYDVSTLPGGVEARRLYWRVDNVAGRVRGSVLRDA